MRYCWHVCFLSILLLLPLTAAAMPWYGGYFSAKIETQVPNQPKTYGKLSVGPFKLRSEATFQGNQRILIVDFKKQQAWTLLPNKRQYYRGFGQAPIPPKPDRDILPNQPQSPCQKATTTCRLLKQASVHGIPAQQWQIVSKTKQIILWIDPTRHIILKQEGAGFPAMERKLLGREQVQNRLTEKWRFTQKIGQQQHLVTQWIDQKLRLPIKVEQAGHTLLSITHIKPGMPDENLFKIPAGFQEVAPPTQKTQPTQPQQNSRSQPPTAQPTYH
ncbi:hypothetical protein ACQZV8_10285 [Magnetococcales bacterium HHB-1]